MAGNGGVTPEAYADAVETHSAVVYFAGGATHPTSTWAWRRYATRTESPASTWS